MEEQTAANATDATFSDPCDNSTNDDLSTDPLKFLDEQIGQEIKQQNATRVDHHSLYTWSVFSVVAVIAIIIVSFALLCFCCREVEKIQEDEPNEEEKSEEEDHNI